jgi:hypothetical protein
MNLGNGWRRVVRFTGKEPPIPTEKEAGWNPEPVWTPKRRKFPAAAGNRTPLVQPVV